MADATPTETVVCAIQAAPRALTWPDNKGPRFLLGHCLTASKRDTWPLTTALCGPGQSFGPASFIEQDIGSVPMCPDVGRSAYIGVNRGTPNVWV